MISTTSSATSGKSAAGIPTVPRVIRAIAPTDRELMERPMAPRIEHGRHVASWCAIAALVFSLAPLVLPSHAPAAGKVVLGGPHGLVKSAKGDLLEGMMVQLIAQKTAIRTTVYSNEDGRFEFPRLEHGTYTLRIAQPREFHPYVKDAVAIDGPIELEDITLTRLTSAEVLPPSPEIAAQMT